MSNTEPTEPYIYQPYGMQDKEFWADKKIYAVGAYGLSTIKGIPKELAELILWWIKNETEKTS